MKLEEFVTTTIDVLPMYIDFDITKEKLYYLTLEATEYIIGNMVRDKNLYLNSIGLRVTDPNNLVHNYVKLNNFGIEHDLPFDIFKGEHNIYTTTEDGKSVSKFSITRTVIELKDLFINGFETLDLLILKHSTDKKGRDVYIIYTELEA